MNKFMKKALEEANIAYNDGNVPVGAVIAKDNDIIAFSHNVKNSLGVSVYHAEMLCIIDACKSIGSWYLDDCVMYVTLRPCRMCEAAIAESRIKKVYYLLDSNYSDNLNTNIKNINFNKIYDTEYAELLSNFFKNIRS
jgi:tRNA(adenine34) deaminase